MILLKKFVLGLVLGLAISFVAGSYASGVWTKIDVLENDVTLYANGVKVEAPNFIYNGRTYAPLREILENMDCFIGYNEEEKEVFAHNKYFMLNDDNNLAVGYIPDMNNYQNFNAYNMAVIYNDGKRFPVDVNIARQADNIHPQGLIRETLSGVEHYDLVMKISNDGEKTFYHMFQVFPETKDLEEMAEWTLSEDYQRIYMLVAERIGGKIKPVPNRFVNSTPIRDNSYNRDSEYQRELAVLKAWREASIKAAKDVKIPSIGGGNTWDSAIQSQSSQAAIQRIENEYQIRLGELNAKYGK